MEELPAGAVRRCLITLLEMTVARLVRSSWDQLRSINQEGGGGQEEARSDEETRRGAWLKGRGSRRAASALASIAEDEDEEEGREDEVAAPSEALFMSRLHQDLT